MTKLKSLQLLVFAVVFTGLSVFMSGSAQAQDASKGEQLFKANCASCHALDKKLVGPALSGVTEKREQEWLFKWIRNSQALVKAGDPEAVAIFEEYNKSPMTAFAHFSDEQISDILTYIENPPVKEVKAADAGAAAGGEEEGGSSSIIIIAAVVILLAAFYAAVKAKNAVKQAMDEETPSMLNQVKAWLLRNPGVLIVIVVLLFIGGIKDTWENVFDKIGVAQNYQPTQPIKFSHKIHAGENGIDCNYCHSGARHSKTAGIPSANVCMNCHTYINEGTQTGTTEISKIYEAVGYDAETRSYKENYTKKPIKWVKIHNLPDLAYFNHAQHVTAGKQKCQTCHGPIEEMEEVKQFAPLTMGWCVECHRKTEINTDNPYYHNLNKRWAEKFHGEKITVDKIGGLECGKCHY
jgi:mono/diheme cytochrome c family protein